MEQTFYHIDRDDLYADIKICLKEGELSLDGYDCGEFVENSPLIDGDDYEYHLKLDKENTQKVFKVLKIVNKTDKQKLSFITEKFKKDAGISGFREYCEKHDIKAEFFCWP